MVLCDLLKKKNGVVAKAVWKTKPLTWGDQTFKPGFQVCTYYLGIQKLEMLTVLFLLNGGCKFD